MARWAKSWQTPRRMLEYFLQRRGHRGEARGRRRSRVKIRSVSSVTASTRGRPAGNEGSA